MGKTGVTGIRRIINAFGYSMKGLRAAFKHMHLHAEKLDDINFALDDGNLETLLPQVKRQEFARFPVVVHDQQM